MTKLYTEWLTICTARTTRDGRTVTAKMLEQAAKNYDPEVYAAIINIDHNGGFISYGEVAELRTGKDKHGYVTLEARICPNKNMLDFQDWYKSKNYTSVEIQEDFSDTGECYLVGLALTDKPASLGTSRIALSTDQNKKAIYLDTEHVNESEESVVLNFLKNLFSNKGTSASIKATSGITKKQEKEMDEKRFSALETKMDEGFKTLNEAVAKFTAKPAATATGEEPPAKTEELSLEGLDKKLTEGLEKLTTAIANFTENPADPATKPAKTEELTLEGLDKKLSDGIEKLTTAINGLADEQPPTQTKMSSGAPGADAGLVC